MLLLWFVILHIPRAIADPAIEKGNEITSVFQALAFSGIAFYWLFCLQGEHGLKTHRALKQVLLTCLPPCYIEVLRLVK